MRKLKVNKGRNSIRSLAFPPVCVLCGDVGAGNRDLCAHCVALLPLNKQYCPHCALPLPTSIVCGQCQQTEPAFDQVFAPYQYADPVRLLIHQFKLTARLDVGRLLAQLMIEQLHNIVNDSPDVIVPIPLHHTKLKKRGFNQSLELSRFIAASMDVAINHRDCRRMLDTPNQSGLSGHARRKNMRGAFSIDRSFSAQHVAIVDDVMTTGSTANELAKALKKSGVAQVSVWVVARAA